jgi:MFS family permease
MLYVAAFALGTGETLFDTAAQSIMPMIVPDHQLSRANSRLYTVELTMNQFVGPPLGSLLVSAAIVAAFGASAAAYVLAAAALVTVAGRYKVVRGGPVTTIRGDIAEGLRYLLGNRVLGTFMAMSGLINGATSAVLAVLPLYAVGPDSSLGLSEGAFGFLLTGTAVGSVVGSLVAHRIERRLGRVDSVALAAVVCGSALVVPALWPSFVPTALALTASGMFFIVWNVVTVSLRQRITPPVLLGRTNAGYRLVALGSMPVGAAAGGLLAEAIGIRPMFLVMGIAGVATVVGRLFVTDADIDAAIAAVASQARHGDAVPATTGDPG